MNQLTIRGIDEALRERLERLAPERGISLNKAALMLLRLGAGLGAEDRPPNVVGDALDEFVGIWTHEEEERFLESIDVLEQVDGRSGGESPSRYERLRGSHGPPR